MQICNKLQILVDLRVNRIAMMEIYNIFLIVMAGIAVIVFVALHFVEAGYGYLFDRRFGPPVSNKIGWIVMEAPVSTAMFVLWWFSSRTWHLVPLVLLVLFQSHYIWRAFIFPLKMRGDSKMPAGIVAMGVIFNTLNAFMQGGWIFFLAPDGYYDGWFLKPYIYVGGVLFFVGMYINRHSDHIIRSLRTGDDRKHYIPYGGAFRYVSSANYFGEIVEWVGFAVASWSWAGVVFVWWTFANLAPRSRSLYRRYEGEFGNEFTSLKRKKILPFIY